MSYTRPQTFVPGAFLMACSMCGVRYKSTDLVRGEDNFWRCRQYCLEVPPLTRDRIAMQSQQRREAPPPKWGLPYDQKDAFMEEAELFDLLVTAPMAGPGSPGNMRFGAAPNTFVISAISGGETSSAVPFPSSAPANWSFAPINETCRYLYNLIIEGKRPEVWIVLARAKLRAMADLLLSTQVTTGTPDTNVVFGAYSVASLTQSAQVPFTVSVRLAISDQGASALSVLYAFRVLGDQKYIDSARNAANVIRHMQWTAYANTGFTSSDGAGTVRLDLGAHTRLLQFDGVNAYALDSFFDMTGLVATEFLFELKATDGDKSYGGLGATGTFTFTVTSNALLSKMIVDAIAFWRNGTYDAVRGDVRTGMSATTPAESFNAFPNSKLFGLLGGEGAWDPANNTAADTTINSLGFSPALRSLFVVIGQDALVTSVYDWLMAFQSDAQFINAIPDLIDIDAPAQSSANSIPLKTPPSGQGNVVPPSYNPKIMLAQTLRIREPSTVTPASPYRNATATCIPATAGHMAAIQAARDPAAFAKAKTALMKQRFSSGNAQSLSSLGGQQPPKTGNLAFVGSCGLSQQLFASTGLTVASIAACGNFFRYGSRGFISSGRPDRTQPGAAPGTLQEQ